MPGSLFDLSPEVPEGFGHRAEFIDAGEQQVLLAEIARLTFAGVEMRGVIARRRIVHFGWQGGYYARRADPGPPLPAFLLPLRQRIAEWAGLDPAAYAEALITEYPPGAPIGWHRDAPMFGEVAGVSLCSASTMRFRPYLSPDEPARHARVRRFTHAVVLSPRSAYLLRGAVRRDFEHHIPPVAARRYSITFRTLIR